MLVLSLSFVLCSYCPSSHCCRSLHRRLHRLSLSRQLSLSVSLYSSVFIPLFPFVCPASTALPSVASKTDRPARRVPYLTTAHLDDLLRNSLNRLPTSQRQYKNKTRSLPCFQNPDRTQNRLASNQKPSPQHRAALSVATPAYS